MNEQPRARWEDDARRNERIRELRSQRQSAGRRPSRRFQPLILLVWFAGVAALAAALIFVGFLAFAPRLMSWVESNPSSIKQGIVLDFVRWYRPSALDDAPAGSSLTRVTFQVKQGASDADIARLLAEKGLISSELAFEYYVIQAGREGTLQAGFYDLSPSLSPSEIIAALRQEAGTEVQVRFGEGWRLEQLVGYLSTTKLTMNLDELTRIIKKPPSDLLAKYTFLANLPAGRSLEGYLFPDTYRLDANVTPRKLVEKLLDTFDKRLTPAIRSLIAKRTIAGKRMTIDQAVILASIVEREAQKASERPLIAGIYVNRLNDPTYETAGLLQADPDAAVRPCHREVPPGRPAAAVERVAWHHVVGAADDRRSGGQAAVTAGSIPDLPASRPAVGADRAAEPRIAAGRREREHRRWVLLLRRGLPGRHP